MLEQEREHKYRKQDGETPAYKAYHRSPYYQNIRVYDERRNS